MADKWIEVNIHLNNYSRTNEALIKNRKNSPKLQERKLDIVCIMLGMQESIYRAAVSDLTPISIRGTAYGIFNTAYGAGISGSFIYLLLGRDFEVGIKFI